MTGMRSEYFWRIRSASALRLSDRAKQAWGNAIARVEGRRMGWARRWPTHGDASIAVARCGRWEGGGVDGEGRGGEW
jgi:hypothetical protein